MSKTFERGVKRGDSRLFQDITLRNQPAQTDANDDPKRDDHGNIKWDTAQTTTVPGEIVYRGTPQFERRVDGVGEEVDIVAWVEDAGGFDAAFSIVLGNQLATDGSGSETQRATRILADDRQYVVRDTVPERNGRLRCHGALEE